MTEPPVEATEAPTAKKHVSQIVKEHFITSSNILKKDKILLQLILYYSVIFSAYTLLFFYSQQYFYDHGLNKIQISIVMFFAGIVACLGALLIATFFNSLLYPIQSNALNQRIPSAQRATLISVNSMFFSVFMILFFPLVGALADIIGLAHAFCIIGVILLIVAITSNKNTIA